LTARGYDVLVAPDGDLAIELACKQKPDLVLLDVKIPKMSGWDILKTLEADESLQDLRVLIMTGALHPGDEEKARELGAVGCLAKPFTPKELLAEIKLTLEEA